MNLPLLMDRIPERIGLFLARRRQWVPAGQAVTLDFDESGDSRLFRTKVSGVIRDSIRDERGEPAGALIELDTELDYAGHYAHPGIRTVVTMPYLRWHGLARLLLTSASVRVIDAPDLAHAPSERTIGLATMRLRFQR